jgi:hypothetical protein
MRRRLLATALAAAFALTAVNAPAASANSFSVACTSSHLRLDDPIVFPGEAGRSHRHEFFGATSADAHATTGALMRAATTCAHAGDTASYWAPSLEVDGRLHRGALVAYYQRAGKRRAAAPPVGLRIIAGDMRARSPQSLRVTSWQCSATPTARGVRSGRHARTVPRCRAGQHLAGWVRFPDCWDGMRTDSADHRSHMAYSSGGSCPATHPVELMRLVLRITWPTAPATSAAHVTLGGGMVAATGLHADFWNAWRPAALRQLRWDCIEVARACGAVRTAVGAWRRG